MVKWKEGSTKKRPRFPFKMGPFLYSQPDLLIFSMDPRKGLKNIWDEIPAEYTKKRKRIQMDFLFRVQGIGDPGAGVEKGEENEGPGMEEE